MIFNKNINFLFWKENNEKKIKIQIPPTFNKIPGYQNPLILTNISNSRIRKIIYIIYNITKTLNFFNIIMMSK